MNAIQVTFDTHAPDEWNTPVPVEVYDYAMRRVGEPRVLYLEQGGTIHVDRPGRYYVLATLPTGESIGASVEVATTGATPAVAELVPTESSPWGSLAWAFTRHRLPQAKKPHDGDVLAASDDRNTGGGGSSGGKDPEAMDVEAAYGSRELPHVLEPGDFKAPTRSTRLMKSLAQELSLGVFRMSQQGTWMLKPARDIPSWWDVDVSRADRRLLGLLRVRRGVSVFDTAPAEYPYNMGWYPLYVCYGAPSREGRPTVTLVAIPAGQALDDYRPESHVLFTREDAGPANVPPVRALVRGARPPAESLLSYLENGVFTAVRQISATVIREAATLLRNKLEDPFGAAIAGYVLLRTAARPEEERDLQGWMRNLADWFPRIPDGAVIYGASLLRGEDAEHPARTAEARAYLLEAVARGIPTYTMGLRLLFDTLRSLAEEREDDTELAAAVAQVRSAAVYADWTAQTTTLTHPHAARSALAPISFGRWRGLGSDESTSDGL